MPMRNCCLVAVFAAGACFTGGAVAAPVSFSNITASWERVAPADRIDVANNGTKAPSMRWGRPATDAGKSGYDFTAAADLATETAFGAPLIIGEFSHLNNPVYADGGVLAAASLFLDLDVNVDGADQGTRTFVFDFTHEETPNAPNPCANGEANRRGVNVNGCADLVTVTENALSESFHVNGVLYTVAVVGFKVGDDIVTTFETMERAVNTAEVVASVSVIETPVPGALFLMLSGLAGIGFSASRRRAGLS